MKRFWISCIAVAVLAWPAWGQKVEREKPDPGKIVHVQTALDHLTVLEMNEPVSAVAVGSTSFRVEWRGNKVFIEPTEPGVATNLYVWTPSGRFSYELDPAGAVPEMVFAIDQPPVTAPMPKVSANRPKPLTDPPPAEVLLKAEPVRLHGLISRKNRVAVYVTDLLNHDGQIFLRYVIRNGSGQVYVTREPQVVALTAPRYRESLYVLRDYQLSPVEATRLKSSGETSIEVTKSEIRSLRIEPEGETAGIVAIKLPPKQLEPTVLQLIFLAGPDGPVSATLVI
ncbi:MAG TPA: hypothetical protein VGR97_06320 [Candidatus Acidoferrales bacterium]|nr:hypothetical protein [Candidatus Acidoferrales bacterium]